jgi:hypothetical protein
MDGATGSATYCSSMDWESFCYRIASEKGVKKDCLNLAYKFSTVLQNDLQKFSTHQSISQDSGMEQKHSLWLCLRSRRQERCSNAFLLIRKKSRRKRIVRRRNQCISIKLKLFDLIKYSVSRLQESEGQV